MSPVKSKNKANPGTGYEILDVSKSKKPTTKAPRDNDTDDKT